MGPFINGYSVVVNNDEGYREIGVIDNTGEEIIEISDKYQSIYYSDKKDEFRFWKEDEIGFIDIKGDEFIEIDGRYLYCFVNGHASFGEQEELGDDIEWGLIDRKGEEIIKAKEKSPIHLYNDLYLYRSYEEDKNGITDVKFGYKNLDGKKIIKAK